MSDEQTTPAAVPAAPPADLMLAAEVGELLGPGAESATLGSVLAWRVPAGEVRAYARRLRDAGWDYLLFVTAVDYPDEQRFEVEYVLARFADGRHIALVTDLHRESAAIDTVSDIWAAADWHEREVYDLFGITFTGHPFLRRILLDQQWVGHPLRKDYVDTLHDVVKRPY